MWRRSWSACDAGREGELIFAYLYQKAGSKKPVQRLWLSSMTNAAMKQAFKSLRPGAEFDLLEQAARSRSEADWIVGMNATRAATIRLRTSFDGAVSLGRVQTPTLAILAKREQEIAEFVPEPYWLVDATFVTEQAAGERERGSAVMSGATTCRRGARSSARARGSRAEEQAVAIVAACRERLGPDHEAREARAARARANALRPDFATARRQHALRLFSAADPGGSTTAI